MRTTKRLDSRIIIDQGYCPVCGKPGLEYWGVAEIDDHGIYYRWNCPHCAISGEEHYNTVFAGHNVEQNEKSNGRWKWYEASSH